jgi:hypothetical protein
MFDSCAKTNFTSDFRPYKCGSHVLLITNLGLTTGFRTDHLVFRRRTWPEPDRPGALTEGVGTPNRRGPVHAGPMGARRPGADRRVRGAGVALSDRCGSDVVADRRADRIATSPPSLARLVRRKPSKRGRRARDHFGVKCDHRAEFYSKPI